MSSKKLSLLFFILLLACLPCAAQNGNRFNLNINNGLPSNHVYNSLVDHHGYLWLATTKGVVKYNGYSFRTFGFADGLPREDVWQLVEDNRGRIWLGCIADEIGYIYNDKYYSITINNSHNSVYPQNMSKNGNGIIFSSAYSAGDWFPDFYLLDSSYTRVEIPKDTILRNYEYRKAGKDGKTRKNDSSEKYEARKVPFPVYIYTQDEQTRILYNNSIYKCIFDGNKMTLAQKIVINDTDVLADLPVCPQTAIREKCIIEMNYPCNFLKVLDMDKGTKKRVYLKDFSINDDIDYVHCNKGDDSTIYIITNSAIHHFSVKGNMSLLCSYDIANLSINNTSNGQQIKAISEDKFWGLLACTTNNGINFKSNTHATFKLEPSLSLSGYTYVGGITDSVCFWWNPTTTMIAQMDAKSHVTYNKFTGKAGINKIISYSKDTFLIMGQYTHFLTDHGRQATTLDAAGKIKIDKIGPNMFAAMKMRTGDFICISPFGFYKISKTNTTNIKFIIDANRYLDLVYIPSKQEYWAYNNSKIFIHGENYNSVLQKDDLTRMGIEKIEKIYIDTIFNNIFAKDNSKLQLLDKDARKCTVINEIANVNIKNTRLELYKDNLILIGDIGVIVLKIQGKNKLSHPILFSNAKNEFYTYIYDVQVSYGKVLMNTDKGFISVTIPANEFLPENDIDRITKNYKFTARYQNATINIKHGDTLNINQKDLKLQFDVINPYGNGELKYTTQIDNAAPVLLNSNELAGISFKPDQYYTIKIKAQDKVWKSDELKLIVYVKPYWWQTHNMRIIIWVSSSLLIVLLFTFSVLITRRMVLNASKKRNMRMEMELKAIYAQINPHFIFNSLNSALLLVSKNSMEDAYTHISKFSRLLRSYIKSSRNKFIPVEEEITNLKNYIELQQVRFKNKFNYDIIADGRIFENGLQLPSLLLQPFVENSIEHGLLNKPSTGNLIIEFSMPAHNMLVCTIDDDGIGRDESKKISALNISKETSYGNLLIKDLVDIFNKYENVNVDINYEDKVGPQSGTIVTIKVKYLNNAK